LFHCGHADAQTLQEAIPEILNRIEWRRPKLSVMLMVLLWRSAITAMFIGTVPIAATLIPMVRDVIPSVAAGVAVGVRIVSNALWWSLAFGVCLGSDGTILGGAANILVVDIARKDGLEISFGRFMMYGVPYMVKTLVIASVYVVSRYML
jgi:Na+/H+ antiporter NhaD/arsenite permease-like protein